MILLYGSLKTSPLLELGLKLGKEIMNLGHIILFYEIKLGFITIYLSVSISPCSSIMIIP